MAKKKNEEMVEFAPSNAEPVALASVVKSELAKLESAIRYAEDPLPWPARGDKAWLKSGSPELRVEGVKPDGTVSASHSLSKDPDGDRLAHDYHPAMLTQTPTPVTSEEWR